MKMHKFRKLLAEHPWLLELVDPEGHLRHDVQTMSIEKKVTPELRSFVRQRVRSISFMPFDQDILLTERSQWEVDRGLESLLRCDPYFGGDRDATYSEQWFLWSKHWHGELGYCPVVDGYTIWEMILDMCIGHAKRMEEWNPYTIATRTCSESSSSGMEVFWYEIYKIPVQYWGPTLDKNTISPLTLQGMDLIRWREEGMQLTYQEVATA
jgi:hypothetical protein